MKGFIIAIGIIALVIGTVFASAAVLHARVGEIAGEIEGERFAEAKGAFDKIFPFLHLCAPDGLLREVELAFCEAGGGEVEKSRLLVLLEDLRRQVGLCPIAVF